jgi:uncharacterized protein YndB with AHSA1/START domain
MTDGRRIELSIEVPGTPEEVWQAIATGPGITSWFVPTEVDEQEGGAVLQHFGDMGSDEGRVLRWDPPRQLVFEGGASAGRPLAFEWTVEAVSGDTCTVRLVNSGFGEGEEWDGDYDGMSMGWRLFLENLRLHLTHFAGRRAVASVPMAMVDGPNEPAWSKLCAALGVSDGLAAGDDLQLPAVGWRGRVDRVMTTDVMRHYVVVLEEPPATGFLAAEGNGDQVAISAYLYFYGDGAGSHAETWNRTWSARWAAP